MEVLRKLPESCPNLSNAEVAVRVVPGTYGMFWETLDEIDYYTPDGEVVKVPRGFITDFASVPRAFWSVLPPWGQYTAAAVIHDYLYFVQDRERWKADKVFQQAMVELNVRFWKRRVMFRAVRVFGESPWQHKRVGKQQTLNG